MKSRKVRLWTPWVRAVPEPLRLWPMIVLAGLVGINGLRHTAAHASPQDQTQRDVNAAISAAERICLSGGRYKFDLKANGDLTIKKIVPGAEAELHVDQNQTRGGTFFESPQIRQVVDQDIRACMERQWSRVVDVLNRAGPQAPPGRTLPPPEQAKVLATLQDVSYSYLPHHSVGLYKCAANEELISCAFVVKALEKQNDYGAGGIISTAARLIDNFHIDHNLHRYYFLDGKGQHQEKLNLYQDDKVWFIAEFEGGSKGITSARIVLPDNKTLQAPVSWEESSG